MFTAEQAVFAAMLISLGAALVTLWPGWRKSTAGWLAFAAIFCSSTLVLAGVGRVLTFGPDKALTFFAIEPLGFALRLYVDGLSAVFLALIAAVTIPVAFYSIDYFKEAAESDPASGQTSRAYYPNVLLFVAAMYGLVSTTDMMWFFFIFWQMMTWAGWALIRYERHKPENLRAAAKYLGMMQLACLATMLGAAVLAGRDVVTPEGERLLAYDFDAVSHFLPERLREQSLLTAFAFSLFLVGFGIKLGMWPFGRIWLPDAHPAAPSPVSALLSGVMIKTGVYGLMRYFLWLVPPQARADYPAGEWGAVIAVLGTVTLFTGTLQGLRQEQSKRLLAFSSIGQAGYIMLGLGVCLTLLNSREPAAQALAAAAFCGALAHTWYHGVFKSLLFLNAGAVLHATGTQDINRLGGLMRWMPVTAVTALIASFSIAGVPLFSGFVSKWSIYVAAVQAGPLARGLPVCAMVAILTSALTLALFIKFFGGMFLARPSTLVEQAAGRHPLEGSWKMRVSQLVLAAACLLFGLFPVLPMMLIHEALLASRQGLGSVIAEANPINLGWMAGIGSASQQSVYAPLGIAVVLGVMFLAARGLARLGGARRRATVPWLCGYAVASEANRYPAGGFYGELKRYLQRVPGWAPAPAPISAEAKPKEAIAWSLEKN